MPNKGRGFHRTNTGLRSGFPSALPSLPSLGTRLPGSPKAPQIAGITAKFLQAYPDVPPGFFGPETEWIEYDDLTRRRKYYEGVDFDRQVALSAPGINTKGFNRADFVFWPSGKAGGVGGIYTRGLVHNPISAFTHPSRGKDLMERAALAQAGYLVIYIEDYDLKRRAHEVIGLGLRGIDVSTRSGIGYR